MKPFVLHAWLYLTRLGSIPADTYPATSRVETQETGVSVLSGTPKAPVKA